MMGTNYYIAPPPCEECGRGDYGYHIGKSSAGWVFLLHVDPEAGIYDLPDVEREMRKDGVAIRDEYGKELTVEEMLRRITEKKWTGKRLADKAFLAENHAEPGPSGLLRHQVDGRHIVGHGEGTWDLMEGEFC